MFDIFHQFDFGSAIEVFIIAIIIYNLLILMRGTRAMQMVIGIFIIFSAVFLFTQFYPLNTLSWMVNKLSPSLIVVLVILFQDDIRRVLTGVGRKPFLGPQENVSSKLMLDEISRSAATLAGKRIGALITIERKIILSKYVDMSIPIDARISHELIISVFHPTSPMHDGSIVIQNGRIAAAGCFLPLTRDVNIDPEMGTRHRAAIGITQETDAIVVLVSEEKGTISLVVDGVVSRPLEPKELRRALKNHLSESTQDQKPQDKNIFQKLFNAVSEQKKS
jgi:diadenylate cyclase